MSIVKELYNSLKGQSRQVSGELYIPGFEDDDYSELWETILESIAPFVGGNYEYFYTKWARTYYRKFLRDRHNVHLYCPQFEKPLETQTIREQLVTLKHFLMVRSHSRYKTKVEERGQI